MKLIIHALLGGVLAPAGFAAAVLLLCRRRWPRSPVIGELAGAVALAGGFFLAYAVLHFAPLRPEQAWHWLPYAALMACAAGVIESAGRLPAAAVWSLRAIVSLVAGWILVPTWESIAAYRTWWILGMAAGILLLWATLSAAAGRLPALRQSFLLSLNWLIAAVIMEFSGSAKFLQLAGVVTATLGAFWLVELIRWMRPASGTSPDSVPSFAECALRGAAPGIAVLLPGLMLNGYFSSYSEVPLASYLLVCFAPVTLCRPRATLPRALEILQVATVVVILAVAVALAIMAEGLGLTDA